jgi:hypothetical protein
VWLTLINYGRFYTPGGTVAHLIEDRQWDDGGSLYATESYPRAACGWWGQHSYWRGTGSQTEYDKAAALPTCRKCVMATTPGDALAVRTQEPQSGLALGTGRRAD